MKIDQDHFNYGAAVIQIAEHPSFTAINDFKISKKAIRCAYWVNDDTGIYLKYRTVPDHKGKWVSKTNLTHDYGFVFNADNLKTIKLLKQRSASHKAFVGLVCVAARQICCLSVDEVQQLISMRAKQAGKTESQYTIWVAYTERTKFRAYVTPHGKRNRILGQPILVAQSGFPSRLFE